MQITLKQGYELAAKALAEAAKLRVEPELTISIYETAAVDDLVTDAARKVDTDIDKIAWLIACAYELRRLVGEANAKAGVTDLLAERARIEAIDKRLTGILVQFDKSRENNSAEPNAIAAERKIANARQVAEGNATGSGRSSYYDRREDRVSVRVISDAQIDRLRARLAELRLDKADNFAQITKRNLETKINVTADLLITLREHRLVRADDRAGRD